MNIRLTYKYSLFLLLVCLSTSGFAKEFTFIKKTIYDKVVKKSFDVNHDAEVNIINKYGKVNIHTWDKNTVEIEVTISVEARNEEAADDVFSRINLNFDNGESFVKAETTIESQSNKWWGSSSDEFTINYEVNMPKSNQLKLFNKYGDSYVAYLNSSAEVEVKYGNLIMEGLNDDIDLMIGYGNAKITSCKDMDVEIKYGKLNIQDLKNLKIESKYSKITLDKAIDINSLSKYDTYRIGEINELNNEGKYDDFEIAFVNSITADSKYTDFEIEELATSARFDLQYGDVNIESVAAGFENIDLEGNYTQFKIEVSKSAEFHFIADSNYGDIKYPEDVEVIYEEENGSRHKVEGFRIHEAAKSKIKARLNYGQFRLR